MNHDDSVQEGGHNELSLVKRIVRLDENCGQTSDGSSKGEKECDEREDTSGLSAEVSIDLGHARQNIENDAG